MNTSYKISFADGFSLQINAEDEKAIPVVELLARTMMLEPGEAEFTLQVLTAEVEELFSIKGKKVFCRILPPANEDDTAFKAMQVSLVIAHLVQKRGGILVHGGLAVFQGQGVILAASGGTGKTTTSNRLPASWRSYSDDAVLIVRNTDNYYSGHPWPTWSRFYSDGPGGSWKAEYSVILKSLYFLLQSQEDTLEELNASQAAAMLIESVAESNVFFNRNMLPTDIHKNHLEQFSIVCSVTSILPAYRLHLSLTGNFWILLEKSLHRSLPVIIPPSAGNIHVKALDQFKKKSPGVVVYGTSMYPTLMPPGYIEVRPYDNDKPRRGDIVHFRSPATGRMFVHRVTAVRPEGIITRGDNNAQDDLELIPFPSVDGKVITVKDSKGSRHLRGGPAGMMDYAYARLLRMVKILTVRIYRSFISFHSLTGSLLRYAPKKSADLKYVFFGNPIHGQLKIMSDDICVGYYTRRCWHIAYPWRLWIDPVKLEAAVKKVEFETDQWAVKFIKQGEK